VLGPQYSYSYNLASEYYTESEIVCVQSIGKVFKEVAEHADHKGVVPVENMINGSVRETFLYLEKYQLKIVRAFDYQIENILASNSAKYTKIASHAQPLAQCSEYIQSVDGIEIVEASSTSAAMQLAAEDDSVAAIGNTKAAQHYGVSVVKTDICNKERNVTRFIEISQNTYESEDVRDKTSIMIRPREDRAGILFEILSIFHIKNINLTKIESIPTGAKMNDYIFYIDIEGDLKEQRIADALRFLKTFVEVETFGSYSVLTK